ncbi:MAG TPA: FadR/GntR family transcriptional regulator [Bordetella sp.]
MVRSTKLPDQVYELLAHKISVGEFSAGERLPSETQLASEFGVSRTVLREAIARLKNEGLVTTRHGLGMFVADSFDAVPFRVSALTRADSRELFELRMGFETEAAALAAKRRTVEQLRTLAQAIEAMEGAVQAGEDGVQEDFQFHRALAEATNNGMYRSFLAFLERHIHRQLLVSRKNSHANGKFADVVQEHRAIYKAVEAGDSDAARQAAHNHLQNGLYRLQF